METHKIGFLLLMAMLLSFGCTHYPSGFFVKADSIDQRSQSDLLICHAAGEKNANLIVPKSSLTSMEYYPIHRLEEAMGALVILAIALPIEMNRRQRKTD